jgi:hypothetical protein
MVTKYVGVFCVRCRRFLVQASHQVECPEIIGADFDVSSGPVFPCLHCGEVCTYSQKDVAHSISPEGTDPQYPHRG